MKTSPEEILLINFSNKLKELSTNKTAHSIKSEKETLKEDYLFIENAIQGSFIKSMNSTTAILLTFNL